MNRKYIEEHDVIDRYLLHQLSEAELRDFSLTMMKDPALQAEVEEARMVMKTLWKEQRPKGAENGSRLRPFIFIGSILLLGSLAYLLFHEPVTKTIEPSNSPNSEAPLSSPIKPAVEEKSTIEESTKKIEINKQQSAPKKENPAPTKPKQVPTKVAEKPIAADLSPNPALESWVGTGFRSNEYSFLISKPPSDSKLSRINGKIDFEVVGEVETLEPEIVAYFQLHLFSNEEEDYKNFKPVQSWDLEFEESDGKFLFSIEEKLGLEAGLYYYLIRDEDTGMKHVVGKMEIE